MPGFDFAITPETTILDLTKAIAAHWRETGMGGVRFQLAVPMSIQKIDSPLVKMGKLSSHSKSKCGLAREEERNERNRRSSHR